MKGMEKMLTLICMLTIITALFYGCSKDSSSNDNAKEEQVTTAPTAIVTPTIAIEPTVTLEPTQAVVNDSASNWSTDMKEMRDISSLELVKEIKIGWNIGNTMDATGAGSVLAETSWGNPKITKELIDAVKEAGFNTVRIPTTWQPHIGPAPDYIIDTAWMDRVQEIVNYCISNDMFVILNAHHEDWYFPSYENADTAKDMMAKVWKQIANRFESYDEHLIFEGMNEPRQKGTNDEWNGGNAEGWDVVNQLNAVFIETIRSAGGNNPLRHLMIPPYAATSTTKAWDTFIVPEDNKIIVSIHAYTPYNFALNKSGTDQWSSTNSSDTSDIDNLMTNLNNKFISKGIPVIIGEFGAMDKKGNSAARAEWATYYISKAKEIGVPCIWWDNGAFYGSGELFGLIDRMLYNWHYPEVNEALMKGLE